MSVPTATVTLWMDGTDAEVGELKGNQQAEEAVEGLGGVGKLTKGF